MSLPGRIDVGGWDLLPWAAALHALALPAAVAIAVARLRATIPPPARWVALFAAGGALATLLLAAALRLASPRASATVVATFGPLVGLVVSLLVAAFVFSLVQRQWATGVTAALLGLSLAISVAPLSFLSTPGDWPRSRAFAGALLNPSLLPLLVERLGAVTALCGTCLLACAIRGGDLQRPRALIAGAALAVGGAVVLYLGGRAWLGAVDSTPLDELAGEPGVAAAALAVASRSALALGATAILIALVSRFRAGLGRRGAVALLLPLAVAAVGAAEVARAALSGPWSVGVPGEGWLYANGLTEEEEETARREGLAAVAPAVGAKGTRADPERGARVAAVACSPCHSERALAARLDGWPSAAIAAAVARLERFSAASPPFPGDAADARDLAAHLARLDGAAEGTLTAPDPRLIQAGRKAFEGACATCHRDVRLERRVAGWNEPLARRVLDRLDRIPAMKAVATAEADRPALAAWLVAMGAGGRKPSR